MNKLDNIELLKSFITDEYKQVNLHKIIFSKISKKSNEIKKISTKLILSNKEHLFCTVSSFQTKDITKNLNLEQFLTFFSEIIASGEFLILDIFTTDKTIKVFIKIKNQILKLSSVININQQKLEADFTHNKNKIRLINTLNPYLHDLGLTDTKGNLLNSMQHKYKQINKYIEIINPYLTKIDINNEFNIYDMGCGKGYLTFALADNLLNNLSLKPKIIGLDIRQDIIEKSNLIAKKNNFDNLSFIKGSIENMQVINVNIIIALHACDTATDDAIFAGIKANSELIICAPCCHKQVRKSIQSDELFKSITKHGILFERQAEILTDTIRSLILESKGYKVDIVEFIEWNETPKNILIIATKTNQRDKFKQLAIEKIEQLKTQFNIKSHYLQELVNQ